MHHEVVHLINHRKLSATKVYSFFSLKYKVKNLWCANSEHEFCRNPIAINKLVWKDLLQCFQHFSFGNSAVFCLGNINMSQDQEHIHLGQAINDLPCSSIQLSLRILRNFCWNRWHAFTYQPESLRIRNQYMLSRVRSLINIMPVVSFQPDANPPHAPHFLPPYSFSSSAPQN